MENEIVKNNNSDVFYDVTKINIEKLYKYICYEFCFVKFKKDKEYRAHLKNWHVTEKDEETNGLVNQPKALKCELCGWRDSIQGIISHMEIFYRVTDILKCELCDYSADSLEKFS